jgi:saccharopine dehydrogenase (NAD+, L-lysine-forming)
MKKDKIIVLGAGIQGSITVRDLCDKEVSPIKSEIVVCDYDYEKAKAAAEAFGVKALQCDVTDHDSLLGAISGAAVVINCVQYDWNIDIMKACLEVGAHYMDLGGLFHITRKQFELDQAFKDAGLLAVLGIGSSPGIMNVMAGYAADKLDTVSEAHVICGCADFTSSNAAIGIPYSLTTIMEEHTKEPWILSGGEFKSVPPGSGKEMIAFPEPIGGAEACYCIHSEPAQFERSFKSKGIQESSFKLALPADFEKKISFLAEIGFASTDAISGSNISPLKSLIRVVDQYLAEYDSSQDGELNDCDVLRVVVKGTKAGVEKEFVVESVVRTSKRWGISAGCLDTGVPPSITTQMILDGRITKRGALSPEECIPAVSFFKELAKREMPVSCIEKTPLSDDDFRLMNECMKG